MPNPSYLENWKAFFSRLPDTRTVHWIISRLHEFTIRDGIYPDDAPECFPLWLLERPRSENDPEWQQGEDARERCVIKAVKEHPHEFKMLARAVRYYGQRIRARIGKLTF